MEYSIKGIIFVICVLAVTVYLIVAATEDAKSMEVTRGKHLIGFMPAVVVWILCASERNIYDIGIIILFIGLWMLCGWSCICESHFVLEWYRRCCWSGYGDFDYDRGQLFWDGGDLGEETCNAEEF